MQTDIETGIRPQCALCSSANVSAASLYKHRWTFCRDCQCATSARKPKYALEYLPSKAWSVLPGRRMFRHNPVLADDPQRIYDYMASPEHEENHAKRELEAKFIHSLVHPARIELAGKRVLDISGGNGR